VRKQGKCGEKEEGVQEMYRAALEVSGKVTMDVWAIQYVKVYECMPMFVAYIWEMSDPEIHLAGCEECEESIVRRKSIVYEISPYVASSSHSHPVCEDVALPTVHRQPEAQ
jgi:hypothetical protein